MDHDQRFKLLLQEFFAEFLQLFFPSQSKQFDLNNVEWLEKEMFPDPPQGEMLRIDLVAKLPHRPLNPPDADDSEMVMALIHIEIESRESAAALR